jgi:hypothetical protein
MLSTVPFTITGSDLLQYESSSFTTGITKAQGLETVHVGTCFILFFLYYMVYLCNMG